MNNKGITLVEVMVLFVTLIVLAAFSVGIFVNNRGATERRAINSAIAWAGRNNIKVKRMSCAGDSDRDGYGTCVITTDKDERINLRCVCDYFSTSWFGASGCKEVFSDFQVSGRVAR